jgi:hypothetical protein
MTHELANGVTLGAKETLESPVVHSQGNPPVSKLAIELEWSTADFKAQTGGSAMRAPIVRGSPYTSILYFNASPRIHAERVLKGPIIVDQGKSSHTCTNPQDKIYVEHEMKMAFEISDISWLVFVSEPMEFTCSQFDGEAYDRSLNLPPGKVSGVKSSFELVATAPVQKAMIRVAMTNNCTTGQNAECTTTTSSLPPLILILILITSLR